MIPPTAAIAITNPIQVDPEALRACACRTRTVPCVCGGTLTATPARGIEGAVKDHQGTYLHRAWVARGGFDPEPADWAMRERFPWAVPR